MTKISYVMNVLNGEPFIRYQLDSIYEHAHEIIIVEGAYEKFRHASTADGRSTDKTVEIVESYPDPDGKITLITKPGFYADRLDMCNEFMGHVTGNVIWQVDVDEFYNRQTHRFVRRCFENNANLDRVSFNFYNLFASPGYYVDGYETLELTDVNRVHRYEHGDRWENQRPPVLVDRYGKRKPVRKHRDGDELQRKGHMMFNCALLFRRQIESKFRYYSSRSPIVSKAEDYLQSVWDTFDNRYFLSGHKYRIAYLRRVPESVPVEVAQMWENVARSGRYEGQLRSSEDIEAYFNTGEHEKYDMIASAVIRLQQNKNVGFAAALREALVLMKKASCLNGATRRHARKVLSFIFIRRIFKRRLGWFRR